MEQRPTNSALARFAHPLTERYVELAGRMTPPRELTDGAFHDDVSGGRLDRPGIKALLSFVRKHRASGIAIIIDDLSRLARDIRVHQDLREPIASAGGQLESPSIEFGDGPGSIFQENLMA